ncbi:MAG: hypothetical protein VKN17_02405 [Cyanobacteriota bacterium]|nr:hypothetical protein [Synechococcus sp. FGCU3]MEB3104615.1 hypothetical protein [Cyanobacteriota bacterium]
MLLSLLAPLALAMGSPWWEQYEVRDTYLCSDRGRLVVERNDAQASVLTGRFRTTLFRENSELPGLRYANDMLRLVIRGDVLSVEQESQKVECLRTDSA